MLKVKIYRHIYHKDIFLAKNWHYCGGVADTEFYYATKDIVKAVADANREGFNSWMSSFLDENRKTRLKAKITDVKLIELDGYKGKLEKELVFNVSDFECVYLLEETT